MATAQKTIVQDELCNFLQRHHLDHCVESIDEVVLDYVITILEDLGDEDNIEENIDVDSFVEMMNAYVPGFGEINSVQVFEWMFQLSSQLSQKDSDPSKVNGIAGGRVRQTSLSDEVIEALTSTAADEQNGNCQEVQEAEEAEDEQVKLLLEMFPDTCTMEITHCLGLTSGDSEEAVQLILDRQESGECIKPKKEMSRQKKRGTVLDDKNLKDQMIARYSYIDADEHKKSYTPVAPKENPKKLVRYLENRIVSTKGEKFTEIKKEDSDEMKKTYVNLKPARKYRFH